MYAIRGIIRWHRLNQSYAFDVHCRRGISRGGTLDYTGTLADETQQKFVDTVNDAIYAYESDDSEGSSPATVQYLDNSNNNWTNLTGNTTDRSSTYSTVTIYDVGLSVMGHVNNIPIMQLFTGISRITQSKACYNTIIDWVFLGFPNSCIVGYCLTRTVPPVDDDRGYPRRVKFS